jgi:1-phosphofructokinase
MAAKVISITLNPSIDRTINLSSLEVGRINRANSVSLDPGGKGVNVSRAVHAFGGQTHAILACGDLGLNWLKKSFDSAGLNHTIIHTSGVVRGNMTIIEEDGQVTKINEPGAVLSEKELQEVQNALISVNLKDAWVVFAGRLNPGLPAMTYRDLAQVAKEHGALVAVDTSGAELKAAISAGVVDLIKPNQSELSELVGRPLTTISEVVSGAREVIAGGVSRVLCSLGADGALLITESGSIHCEPAHAVQGNPVGAGDILLGIFLAAGADQGALRDAVSWSAASVPLPGTSIPTFEQASEIEVRVHENPDLGRTILDND